MMVQETTCFLVGDSARKVMEGETQVLTQTKPHYRLPLLGAQLRLDHIDHVADVLELL